MTETTVSTPKQTTTTTLVAAGGPAPSTSVAAFATTPGTDLGRSRYAVVAFAVLGLGSALGALELTKRARRPAPSAESGLIQVHAR